MTAPSVPPDRSQRRDHRRNTDLRASEGRLRAIFENSAIGIALTDLAGRYLVTNPAYQTILGYSDEELRQTSCGELTLDTYREQNNRFAAELIEGTRQYFQLEKEYRRKDGTPIWVLDTVSLISDPEGQPRFALALIEDITERKRTEEALKRSEERFKAQYKGIPIPTYTWRHVGDDYILIDCNDAAAVFTHGRAEDLIGSAAKELYNDLPDILDDFSRCVAARAPTRRELRYRMRSTGATVDLIVTYAFVPPDLVMVHTEDISARKRAEEEVRLSLTIALSVSEAEDLQSALEVTLRKVCEATGWVLGQAWVPHPDGALLECSPAWHATAPGLDTFRQITEASAFSSGNGLPGRVWVSKRPVWVRDVTQEQWFARALAAQEAGLKAGIAVPVLAGDEIVAVLEFFMLEQRAEDERLLQLVSGVAAQLGTVIHRKRAEDALRESEAKYRLLMEQASDAILIMDREGHYLEVNERACELLGYSREELVQLRHADLIPAEDLAADPPRIDEVFSGKTLLRERRLRRKDGSLVPVELSTKMVGENRMQSIARDITERKRVEAGILESEARLRRQNRELVELAKRDTLHGGDLRAMLLEITEVASRTLDVERSGVWLYNEDRTKVRCMDLYERGTGRHSEGHELAAEQYPEHFGALEEARTIAAHDARSDPRTREFLASYLEPLGITSMIAAPIRSGGKLIGVFCHEHVGAARQWTSEEQNFAGSMADLVSLAFEAQARTHAQESLRVRARQQAVVADLGQRALAEKDAQTLMDEAVILVARTLDAELSKVLELLPDGSRLLLRAGVGWQEGLVGRATVDTRPDSQAGFTLLSSEPVIVEDLRAETRFHGPPILHDHGVVSGMTVIIHGRGRPWGVLGAHTRERRAFSKDDVHFLQAVANVLAAAIERGTTEETLRQTEKLAAMGQLLAGVAHEMNNPLAVVIGQTYLLRQLLEEGPLKERAEKISQAAERCARIVRDFLALARRRSPERQPVKLNQVVEAAVELLAYALRVDSVEVTLDLAKDLPIIWADSHQLHQMIVNLVSNAHHAMREQATPRRLVLTARYDPRGETVSLEVADTGPGFPSSIRSRIFEPFFTTKPVGQGTGLGLSICHRIAESHGGTIRLAERQGFGAVIRIELPAGAPPSATRESPRAEFGARLPGMKILIVDDEPEVAELLGDLLSRDGHQVETADNGEAALRKLDGRVYDLILSDVRMPQLDGPTLLREVTSHHPELSKRIIFITGDALSDHAQEFLRRTTLPTVGKPFTVEELRRALQVALSGA